MADRYASLKQGLVGCWIPSISGSGLLLPDLSGRGNNGSLVGMDASDWVSGQYGRALDFDGVNDYVNLGANHNLTGAFSFSIWANLRSKTGYKLILAKSDFGSSPNKREFLFYVSGTDLTPTDSLTFVIMNPTSFANRIGRSLPNASIPLNQFTNFICTYTGNGANSGIAIYINGVRSDTTDQGLGTFTGVVTQTTPLAIGTDFNNFPSLGNQAYMISDDIRVYNRALTESEIRLLASEPGIGFKPAKKLSRFSQRFTYNPPKPRNYSVIRVKETDYATLRQGLVGAWCPSLPNGGSGNTLPDQSGFNNHGSLVNMGPEDWVSGQYGRALDFDGSNDYVLIGSPASIAVAYPQFTKSLWVLLRNTSLKYLFADFNNAGTTSRLSIAHDTRFFAFQNTATVVTSTTTITTGVWYHVAVTRDDGTGSSNTGVAKIYINGNLEASSAYSYNSPALQISGEQLARSNALYGDHPDCQIDDARIYNRILTESEIRLLASEPGIGLRQESHRQTFYQFPSGARRKRILTGMP